MYDHDEGIDFADFLHAIETGYSVPGDELLALFGKKQPIVQQSLVIGSQEHDDTLRFIGEIEKFHKGRYRYEMFPYFMRRGLETISRSDFSQLTANTLYWRLLPLYAQTDNQWEKLVSINDSIPDFRAVKATQIEGMDGPFPKVPELSDYPMVTMTAGDKTYSVSKFGTTASLSWEASLSDFLGMFQNWPKWLARGARATENSQIVSLLASAAGPNSVLFSTDGSSNGGVINEVTGATNGPLNEANLIAAYVAMTSRKVASGNPMAVQPRYLVVPPALRFAAEKLLESPTLIAGNIPTSGTAGLNTMIPNYNAIPKLGLEVVENRWFANIDTSGNVDKTWYLVGEPSAGAAMEAGFLIGHRQPMIFRKAPNSLSAQNGAIDPSEGDFERDAIAWKIRHVLGGIALEPRYAYAAVGA